MKFFAIIACILMGTAISAEAKTFYLDDVIAKATKEEQENLVGLLQSIKIVPTKKKQDGNTLYKVEKIEEVSFPAPNM